MERSYNRLRVQLDKAERYLIWGADIEDAPVLDADGEIPVFASDEELAHYASRSHISLDTHDNEVRNLDDVQQWILAGTTPPPCDTLLSAWNLFSDIALTLHVSFSGNAKSQVRNTLYEKLFWGSNRPTLSAAGARFTPSWKLQEIEKLRQIMMEGLSILRGNMKYYA